MNGAQSDRVVLVSDSSGPGITTQPEYHLADGDTTHPVCGRDGTDMRRVQRGALPSHTMCIRCKRYAGEVLDDT